MKYLVKRYWEMSDSVFVDADSDQEAIEKAHELSLSAGRDEPEFVMDSMNSDLDVDVQLMEDDEDESN